MFDEVIQLLESLSSEEKLFTASAKVYSQMYKALQKEGFTKDEAMKIISSHSPMPGGKGPG